jgi:bifunctional non-homologous end joining protein LigD
MPTAGARRARAKKGLPRIKPIRPVRRADAFDSPDWIYELKYDGFRALAYVEVRRPRLVSRNRNEMSRFATLAESLAAELNVRDAILDGEIVCVDKSGRPLFHELFFRRGRPMCYAFDLLWLGGKDLRALPLRDRKAKLQKLLPSRSAHLGYVEHWAGQGKALFQEIKKHDLEGIVAKRADAPYTPTTTWYKIKNSEYSQAEGRNEMFERFQNRGAA